MPRLVRRLVAFAAWNRTSYTRAFHSGVNQTELAKPAADVERLAGDPPGVRGGEECDRRRDVLRLANAAQWDGCREGLEFINDSRRARALGFDRAGIDRVDPDLARPEFFR